MGLVRCEGCSEAKKALVVHIFSAHLIRLPPLLPSFSLLFARKIGGREIRASGSLGGKGECWVCAKWMGEIMFCVFLRWVL